MEQALAEGGYVARTLGRQLIAVQFGNEPDLFKHRDKETSRGHSTNTLQVEDISGCVS